MNHDPIRLQIARRWIFRAVAACALASSVVLAAIVPPPQAFGQRAESARNTTNPEKTARTAEEAENADKAEQAAEVDFNRDVRPILAANCFACHGPDEEAREADLRLDTAEGAVRAGAEEGPLVPGKRSQSQVYLRIRETDPDLRMPPPDSGHDLTERQIETIGRWIDQGAKYQRHWAFVPPERPPLPKVSKGGWPRNPIDHFILARLDAVQLSPSPEADRATLIRRLSLDLTGLPPTPAQVDRFLEDRSPGAYERLVDRLLASPQFGEHWARMWLDLARYADTKGYEKDQPREIWRYRDWVIAALNRDLPYDRFTRDQLAGDLLPDATTDQVLATAFHRNTMTNDEGGTDNEEFRVAAVKDRVDTTVQVWMGLTMGCAKCHSHKYDPITQREYYEFLALFNQTEDADRPDDAPRAATPTATQARRLERLREETARLEAEYLRNFRFVPAAAPAWSAVALANLSREDVAAVTELSAVRRQLTDLEQAIPRTPVMRELPAARRRATHVHVRGNFLNKGDVVQPGFPAGLGELPQGSPSSRLDVAQWLTSPANPLTPRVAVNRVWSRLMGRGIVETEEDFGRQGMPPSHPELLDWLAVEFRDSLDWSLKGLIQRIVTSSAYRQASSTDDRRRQTDPDNALYSRGPRFRLPAETVRDQALAAAGLLSRRMGGPSVMPPQPPGIWRTTYSKLQWVTSPGGDRYRRGLYTYWRRTSPYPSMITFDAGSREVCVIRRVRTNTPLQALVTLNDPVFFEAARGVAERLMREGGSDEMERARYGFRLVLTRSPSPAETQRLAELFRTCRERLAADPRAVEEILSPVDLSSGDLAPENAASEQRKPASGHVAGEIAGDSSAAPVPSAADIELAAWTLVGNTLLNLDETLTRN